jgi:iron(III) transport system ATP-binding protein
VVEQIGSPFEIYTEPTTLFVARFVGHMNLIRATADERSGWARVGFVELRHRPGPRLPAGSRVTLAIRPEEILIGPAARNGENRIVTRICAIQFLGAFTRLGLALPGETQPTLECDVAVNALAEVGVREGAELPLVLKAEALRLFPDGG